MAKAKAEPAAAEWKTHTVAEFKVPGTTAIWRTQTSKAPDGTEFAGLRKFAVKADGKIINTNAGFAIANDATAPRLLRKLSKMLASMADTLEDEGFGDD